MKYSKNNVKANSSRLQNGNTRVYWQDKTIIVPVVKPVETILS